MDLRIGAKLGRGPVGTTYAGHADGAAVTIKVITSRFNEQPQLLQDVLADVRAWVGFRHPNIAATLGLAEQEGRHVIIFETSPGRTLEQWLKEQGPFDPRIAVRILRDVTMALVACHGRGQPVGDLRAAKVFWDGQRAQLADLGLSRASSLAAGLGRLGLHFGHPEALAPEVLARRQVRPTAAADVYALGCLLHQLIAGAPPFQGEPAQVLQLHASTPFPVVPAIAQSPALQRLLARMVAKSPEERLQDGNAVLQALYELIGRAPAAPADARMSTGQWNAASIQEQALKPAGWTAQKVDESDPAGPALAERTLTSGLIVDPALLKGLAQAASSDEQPAAKPPLPLGTTLDEQPSPFATTSSAAGKVTPLASSTGSGVKLPPRPAEPPKSDAGKAKAPAKPAADGATPAEGEAEKKPVQVKLGQKIGDGPVGSTYQGELKDHPGPVAVKVISSRFSKYPDLLNRILRSLRAAEGLQDPHLVGILRVAHVGGRDIVVQELCPGGRTLRALLDEAGPLPAPGALDVMKDVAQALQIGRARDVAHGDVRPEKVFVVDGGYRLTDFGQAEASGLGGNFGQFGVPWGHPDYLAPEVIQERGQPTFASDVYALGCMAYELVAGHPPFRGPTPREVLKQHLEAPLPPLPKEARVPAPLAELLLKLTAKDPKRRPQGSAELLQAIERCGKQVERMSDVAAEAAPPVEEFDLMGSGDATTAAELEKYQPKKSSKPPTKGTKRPG